MTKKDFELIANVIATAPIQRPYGKKSLDAYVIRETIAYSLADRLRDTNPRFDRDRFLRACGVLPPPATK